MGVLRARHTGTVPTMTTVPRSPSCWPRWFPSLTQQQEHIWEHTAGLCHTQLCQGAAAPKEKKGGEGQRHKGKGGGERRGAKLPLYEPPCPALTLPTGRKLEPRTGQERSSHTPGLRDTAPRTLPALQPRRQLRPPRRPLPGRKTSTGGSLSDRVRLRLSPQPPSCSTSSTEGGRLPGTSRERGRSAPAQTRGTHGRGGPRFST